MVAEGKEKQCRVRQRALSETGGLLASSWASSWASTSGPGDFGALSAVAADVQIESAAG